MIAEYIIMHIVSLHIPGVMLYDPGAHDVQLEADGAPAKVSASSQSNSVFVFD